jgi:hypothetical protein
MKRLTISSLAIILSCSLWAGEINADLLSTELSKIGWREEQAVSVLSLGENLPARRFTKEIDTGSAVFGVLKRTLIYCPQVQKISLGDGHKNYILANDAILGITWIPPDAIWYGDWTNETGHDVKSVVEKAQDLEYKFKKNPLTDVTTSRLRNALKNDNSGLEFFNSKLMALSFKKKEIILNVDRGDGVLVELFLNDELRFIKRRINGMDIEHLKVKQTEPKTVRAISYETIPVVK